MKAPPQALTKERRSTVRERYLVSAVFLLVNWFERVLHTVCAFAIVRPQTCHARNISSVSQTFYSQRGRVRITITQQQTGA